MIKDYAEIGAVLPEYSDRNRQDILELVKLNTLTDKKKTGSV